MSRAHAAIYLGRWELLFSPLLLHNISLRFLATKTPEDFLHRVLSLARIPLAQLPQTFTLACCLSRQRCFQSTTCYTAPLYGYDDALHALGDGMTPFDARPTGAPPPKGENRTRGVPYGVPSFLIRGKYIYDLELVWRHVAALSCPGASYQVEGQASRWKPCSAQRARRSEQRVVIEVPSSNPPHRITASVSTEGVRVVSVGRGQAQWGRQRRAHNGPTNTPWFCPGAAVSVWPSPAAHSSATAAGRVESASQVAAAGACESDVDGSNDCNSGASGGWAAKWNSPNFIFSLRDCVRACTACPRCRYVSVSFRPHAEECMWFSECPRFPDRLHHSPQRPDMVTVHVTRQDGR